MAEQQFQYGLSCKSDRAAAIVAEMSLAEKAAFCSGRNFWHLQANERLGLPSVMLTDGPHGLRKQAGAADHVGLNASVPATCYPTASALASSWDRELLHEIGVALGQQCAAENVAVLLGPGMNIKRHPLCGRNFEYFSEDPLLTGELAAALIDGIQSQGVGASVKHYAVNNQEHGRMFVDAIVDERALREIYLRGFEIAVRKAQPWTVMCAYNRLNGIYCSEHEWLLNQVLREEWGFQGLVVTDWGAANDRVRGISAGLDLEMPASGGINDRRVLEAVQSNRLSEAELDRSIVRNVSLSLLGAELAEREVRIDRDAHHALAQRAAGQCMVLLKNDAQALPLRREARIAVIGAFAKQPRYQGAGSSQVTPTRLDCAFDAIAAIVDGAAALSYAPGYDPEHSEPDAGLIAEAVAAAESAEAAVIFAGLPGTYESEGFDRQHMRLPRQHDQLIAAVCRANGKTVVVLCNGAPVAMPWIDAPRAVLEGYLAGQAGGTAIAEVLFGLVNPSGKLAETFPLQQADVPADHWFPGQGRQVLYREGLYVGYRYFDSAAAPVLFPFGHGLSYTHFDYANLKLSTDGFGQGGELRVALDVTNSGALTGAEVVQLYVHQVESTLYRPEQELRAFAKLAIAPGATREVILALDDSAFATYDAAAQRWIVAAGAYEIRIGASSRDIRLRAPLTVNSEQRLAKPGHAAGVEDRPSIGADGLTVSDAAFASMLGRPLPAPEGCRPYHLNSSLNEIAESALGRLVRAKVVRGFQQRMGVSGGDATTAKMFEEMVNNMPLRSLALFGRGQPGFKSLSILLALLNKRFFAALGLMVRRPRLMVRRPRNTFFEDRE